MHDALADFRLTALDGLLVWALTASAVGCIVPIVPYNEGDLMKTAIVVLSDPEGGEEALGRVFNALAAAYDLKQRRDDVKVVFQGAGTRWAAVLERADHPAHTLYQAVITF